MLGLEASGAGRVVFRLLVDYVSKSNNYGMWLLKIAEVNLWLISHCPACWKAQR